MSRQDRDDLANKKHRHCSAEELKSPREMEIRRRQPLIGSLALNCPTKLLLDGSRQSGVQRFPQAHHVMLPATEFKRHRHNLGEEWSNLWHACIICTDQTKWGMEQKPPISSHPANVKSVEWLTLSHVFPGQTEYDGATRVWRGDDPRYTGFWSFLLQAHSNPGWFKIQKLQWYFFHLEK